MSIFPDYVKRKKSGSAEHNGAEPRAQRAAQQHTSNAQAQRPGEAGAAASKTHRFDKFAKRVAANLLDALRVTLTVFSSPDKERWPMVRLISHLKGAEELARDMLREIAAKIFVRPMIVRERSVSNTSPPEPSRERAPYFRLGVGQKSEPQTPRHPPTCSADLPPQSARPDEGGPGLALRANQDDDTLNESSIQNRLIALEDVLAHPGKHAARMARALYRAEHGRGERLMALSPDDRLMENILLAMDANASGDDAGLTRLHGDVMRLEPG